MVRVRGGLCRNRKGHFTKCRKPVAKGKGKGFAKKHSKGIKGKCVKWSKGKTKCLQRANPAKGYGKAAKKGRCIKWSKGRTRCMRRAA
jgi:hypothetical protein